MHICFPFGIERTSNYLLQVLELGNCFYFLEEVLTVALDDVNSHDDRQVSCLRVTDAQPLVT
jgi:hypothetical protein